MSILTYLIITHSIQTFNCQDEISLKFKLFLEDMNQTHYEMFNRFDIDDNQCIDSETEGLRKRSMIRPLTTEEYMRINMLPVLA